MIHVVVVIIVLLIGAYFAYEFVIDFKNETGSLWEKLLAAGKGSATILWTRFVSLIAAVSAGLVAAADWLNAPGISTAIQSYLKPEYVAGFVLVLMLITEFARRRSLPSA